MASRALSNEYDCGPGLCVMFNNMKFSDPKLKDLPSGRIDEKRLRATFAALGFVVKSYQNLTASAMETLAKTHSMENHNGAFFLIVSSHGGEGDVVYGSDGGTASVHNWKRYYHATNCPSLAGRPKVFIVDACRGTKKEGYLDITSKSMPQSSRTSGTIRVTDTSDMLTIFASTRGHTAGCDDDKGSYLIQAFVNILKKASTNDHLLDIMNKVKQEVKIFFKGKNVQTPEITDSHFKKYYIKRSTELNKYLELNQKLDKAVEEWLPVRKQTIIKIREVANNLQEHHSNVNKSRIVGATASIGGGALAILGFALAPFTFGGSLALAGIGISTSIAGGVTVAGSSIADIVIEKSGIKDVQKLCDKDYQQLCIVEEIITEIKQVVENVYKRYIYANPRINNDVDEFISIMTQFLSGAVRTGNLGIRIAELAVAGTLEVGVSALRFGGAAAKGIAGAAIGLNIILIPIDLLEIVRSSISLANGSNTKAITKLREHATRLEKQMKTVKMHINMV